MSKANERKVTRNPEPRTLERLHMKIINLTRDSNTYTSNVYLLLGDWKGIDDVNAMIDVGGEGSFDHR